MFHESLTRVCLEEEKLEMTLPPSLNLTLL